MASLHKCPLPHLSLLSLLALCYEKTKLEEGMGETHLTVIILLSLVSLDGPDDIASIFDHHLTCINVPLTEQPPAVDGRPKTATEDRSMTDLTWKVHCVNTE